MRGLFLKSIYEVWVATLLCGLGLLAIIALLTFILPQIVEGMSEMFEQMQHVNKGLMHLYNDLTRGDPVEEYRKAEAEKV